MHRDGLNMANLPAQPGLAISQSSRTTFLQAVASLEEKQVPFFPETPLLIFQFTLPSPLIFSPTKVTYVLGGLVTITGVVIMGICIKKYFLSLSGIKTLITDHTVNDLQITGIHKYVRHPLYSGTFLFVIGLFILFPSASLLIAVFFVIGYTLLGIKWEEEKLIAEFGNQYLHYKKKVPKLIPFSKSTHTIN